MKRFIRFVALSSALMALLITGGVFAQDDMTTIVIGFEQEPPNLRPLNTLTYGGFVEGFYALDMWEWDRNREAFPVMVDEIPSIENGMVEVTDDGKTVVTVTLKDGLMWSDGVPITTADCELHHRIKSDTSTSDSVSRGTYPDIVESWEAVDDQTFVITYNLPFPDFSTKQPEWPECQYPAHIYGDIIDQGMKLEDSPYFTGGGYDGVDGAVTVGYGPYKMVEWSIGERMVFEKNEYWQGNPPVIDQVIVRFITDDVQMRNALDLGEIDLAHSWSDDLQPEYASYDNIETFSTPGVYTDALWMRTGENGVIDEVPASAAMLDPNVRKAMVYALDRPTMAEQLVAPGITPGKSWYPEQLWPADLEYLEYDPQKAIDTLAEAGWVDSNSDGTVDKDGVELAGLRFITTENTLRNNYQLVIQEYLAEVGIGVDIQIVPATVMFAGFADRGALTTYEWDLSIFANSADPLSPLSDASSYYCSGIPSAENPDGFNPWQFCDPRYDEVDQMIQTTFPGPERDALIAEAVTRFHDGYFWHGLRQRPTWFAVNSTRLNVASVEGNVGTLASDMFNQIANWELP